MEIVLSLVLSNDPISCKPDLMHFLEWTNFAILRIGTRRIQQRSFIIRDKNENLSYANIKFNIIQFRGNVQITIRVKVEI